MPEFTLPSRANSFDSKRISAWSSPMHTRTSPNAPRPDDDDMQGEWDAGNGTSQRHEDDLLWYTDRHLMYHEVDHDEMSGGSGSNGLNPTTPRSGDSETWRQTLGSPKVVAQALLFGLVNVVMALPTMYGYAAVIFRDGAYAADMPNLSKLVCFSSAVHQVMFLLLSAMPFSIGQVQDAGLIFLSHIASNVAASARPPPHLAHACRHLATPTSSTVASSTAAAVAEAACTASLEQRTITSSCLVLLGVCTASLGVVLVVVGRARLAKFVAYLPMPVISGYLAFIGFFCIEAGLSLSTGMPLLQLGDWFVLFADSHAVLLCAPGLLAGAALCVVSRKATNESVLPAVMLLIPLLFYACLLFTGSSMQDARDFGWVGGGSADGAAAAAPGNDDGGSGGRGPATGLMTLVDLFDFDLVDWSLLPRQLPVWCSMVVVVAFSSCLDVAAIEMDVGEALDVNKELQVVGWSNVVSGCLGGFTGSYIFSQTIFTCRSGANKTRIVGSVVAVSEFLVAVVLKVDLLEFVPLFFFAATLIFIGIDLITEWLLDVRQKLEANEYAVVLLTFAAINALGLNEGLSIGVLGSALQFLFQYASQANIVTQVDRQSLVLRTPAASAMIHRQYQRGTIATLELKGSLFFGSSLKILEEVKDVINGRPHDDDHHHAAPGMVTAPTTLSSSQNQQQHQQQGSTGHLSKWRAQRTSSISKSPKSLSQRRPLTLGHFNLHGSANDADDADADDRAQRRAHSLVGALGPPSSFLMKPASSSSPSLLRGAGSGGSGGGAMPSPLAQSNHKPAQQTGGPTLFNYGATATDGHAAANAAAPTLSTPHPPPYTVSSASAPSSSLNQRPRFLVLEFSSVVSIDATAVHSCFASVCRLTQSVDCKLVYAGCIETVESQLRKHGAFNGDHVRIFPTLHRALDWCESVIIARARRNLQAAAHRSSPLAQPMPPPSPVSAPGRPFAKAEGVGGERSAAGRRHNVKGGCGGGGGGGGGGSDDDDGGEAEGESRSSSRSRHGSDGATSGMDLSSDGMLGMLRPLSTSRCSSTSFDGSSLSPSHPGVSWQHLSKEVHRGRAQQVLKVDTLLRQWLELRPEVPPAQVRPWLFLGGAHHACDKGLLERLDVGFVLNVADDIANFFEREPIRATQQQQPQQQPQQQQQQRSFRVVEYCNLGVSDYGQDAGIRRVFPEATRFCAQARDAWTRNSNSNAAGAHNGGVVHSGERGGGTLLVHCRFGMNRSPAVLTAVLMELEGLSLKQAWRSVKTLCHSAYPQLDNRRELVAFEVERLNFLNQQQQVPASLQAEEEEEEEEVAGQQATEGSSPPSSSSSSAEVAAAAAAESGTTGAPTDEAVAANSARTEQKSSGHRQRANSVGSSSGATATRTVVFSRTLPPPSLPPPLPPSMGPDEFKSHGVDDAAQLSAYSRTEEYASDEALFRLGDHADELYLLLAGTVDLVGSDGTTKMSLSPGNVFGFVDSQLGKPRTSSAFARAPALTSSPRDQDSRLLGTTPPPTQLQAPQEGVGATTPRAGVGQQSSSPFVVQVAAISMASLERMSADHPRIAVKLMKVLLRQSSLELSQQH